MTDDLKELDEFVREDEAGDCLPAVGMAGEGTGKFADPQITADGEERAFVKLTALRTLWFNTGTLCNITCANCYILSSPRNDRLVYLDPEDVRPFLDEITDLKLETREIGLTGGEPFMNPHVIPIIRECLSRGLEVLVLTNAMQPLQRQQVQAGLLDLLDIYGQRLRLRVSLDHYTQELHDRERGAGSFTRTVAGLKWLCDNGFRTDVAGRTCWDEPLESEREGYRHLFAGAGLAIDVNDPTQLVLFPEMDPRADVPEITTRCWDILGKSPDDLMCASSRMVVKRKGARRPTVVACTLLPYERDFELGETLGGARMFSGGKIDGGVVRLNHPFCAQFCVLGGASCSVADGR